VFAFNAMRLTQALVAGAVEGSHHTGEDPKPITDAKLSSSIMSEFSSASVASVKSEASAKSAKSQAAARSSTTHATSEGETQSGAGGDKSSGKYHTANDPFIFTFSTTKSKR
jgi:hypothetical protein